MAFSRRGVEGWRRLGVLVWLYVTGLLGLGVGVGALCAAKGVEGRCRACLVALVVAGVLGVYAFALLAGLWVAPLRRVARPFMSMDAAGFYAAVGAIVAASASAGMGGLAGLRGATWLLGLDLRGEALNRAALCIASTNRPGLTMAKLFVLRVLLGPIPFLLYLGRICRRRR